MVGSVVRLDFSLDSAIRILQEDMDRGIFVGSFGSLPSRNSSGVRPPWLYRFTSTSLVSGTPAAHF